MRNLLLREKQVNLWVGEGWFSIAGYNPGSVEPDQMRAGMKFKNMQIKVLFMGLAACCLLLVACKNEGGQEEVDKASHSEVSRTTSGRFQSYPSAVRSRIFFILKKQGIVKTSPFNPTLEDVQRINFAMPGDPDFGTNPEWELFGEEIGGSKAALEDIARGIAQTFDGGRFYVTLSNKVDGLGSKDPELIAIFPDFPADLCGNIIGDVFDVPEEGLNIPVSETPNLMPPPAIAEDLGTVPLMENWPYDDMVLGCYRDQNEVYYYYQVLIKF